MGDEIIVFNKLDSTNTYLFNNFNNYKDKTIVLTKEQTNGKGRLGRTWHSEKDQSLAMSILLKKDTAVEWFSALPLYTGIVVVKALKSFGIDNVGLKWVNDIVYQGKKLGGILAECKVLSHEAIYVLGIGINIDIPYEIFMDNNLQTGISLTQITKSKIEIMDLANEIKNIFFRYYDDFFKNGLKNFKTEYEKYCVNIGKNVLASNKKEKIKGKCMGINEKGNLLLQTNNGVVEIYAGEASIRGEHGYY